MRDPPQGTPSTRCSSPSLPGAPLHRSVPPGRRGAGFGPAPSPPPSSSPHEGDVIQRAAGAGAIHAARLVVIPAGSKGTGWGACSRAALSPGGTSRPGCPQGALGQEQEHAAPSPATHSPGLAARVEPGTQPPAAPGLQGTWRLGGKRVPGAWAPHSAHPGWPQGLFMCPSSPPCHHQAAAMGSDGSSFGGRGGAGHTATALCWKGGCAAPGEAGLPGAHAGRKGGNPQRSGCWPAALSPPKWPKAPGWPQQRHHPWGTTTQQQPAGPSRGSGAAVPKPWRWGTAG